MADTLTTQSATPATIPASTVIATDYAGASGHVQIVKLARSTDGSATPITADADGMLVNLGSNNDVTVTGSVTANAGTNLNTSALALESGGNLAAAATSLAALDNAVGGNELQVDVVAALPAGCQADAAGTRGRGARTLRRRVGRHHPRKRAGQPRDDGIGYNGYS